MPPVTVPAATAPIRVPALAWLAVAFAVAVVYLVLQENGAVLASYAEYVHEFTHDGRHALGVPCH
ncbi:CbtB-domain containing protein [Solwaraspora sp. WMMD1047]|uniref:CbtB domain-containing protein n=1 Tax=Solwaraspora sp. WMMD1047 TaxID=3016102 RepID=UPI002417B7AB|nr:CbtB-domain containing protein [Solwaraspora sp. WMMD1047]MDG4832830.1 CbtB-domain containing protein [Solwaraspora sp. WMMD1047]